MQIVGLMPIPDPRNNKSPEAEDPESPDGTVYLPLPFVLVTPIVLCIVLHLLCTVFDLAQGIFLPLPQS